MELVGFYLNFDWVIRSVALVIAQKVKRLWQ